MIKDSLTAAEAKMMLERTLGTGDTDEISADGVINRVGFAMINNPALVTPEVMRCMSRATRSGMIPASARIRAVSWIGAVADKYPAQQAAAMNDFTAALKDEDYWVRHEGVEQAGKIGLKYEPQSAAALQVLGLAVLDHDDALRTRALTCTGAIGTKYSALAQEALGIVNSSSSAEGADAEAAGKIGAAWAAQSATALAVLADILKTPGTESAYKAAIAAGQIGSAYEQYAAAAMALVLPALTSRNDGVRMRAAEAAGLIGGTYHGAYEAAALEALAPLLEDGIPVVRDAALKASRDILKAATWPDVAPGANHLRQTFNQQAQATHWWNINKRRHYKELVRTLDRKEKGYSAPAP